MEKYEELWDFTKINRELIGTQTNSFANMAICNRPRGKKTWSVEEDFELLRLVDLHGGVNWTTIAQGLIDRTGKQCRERYHNHLRKNVKKGNWTEQEDDLILRMQSELGNQWAKITRMLPGRTDNDVKNRWHAAVRNRARRVEIERRRRRGITSYSKGDISEGDSSEDVKDPNEEKSIEYYDIILASSHDHSHEHKKKIPFGYNSRKPDDDATEQVLEYSSESVVSSIDFDIPDPARDWPDIITLDIDNRTEASLQSEDFDTVKMIVEDGIAQDLPVIKCHKQINNEVDNFFGSIFIRFSSPSINVDSCF